MTVETARRILSSLRAARASARMVDSDAADAIGEVLYRAESRAVDAYADAVGEECR